MLVSVIPVAARTVQNAVVSILFHMSKSKVKSLQACTQTWKLGVGGGGGGGGWSYNLYGYVPLGRV